MLLFLLLTFGVLLLQFCVYISDTILLSVINGQFFSENAGHLVKKTKQKFFGEV